MLDEKSNLFFYNTFIKRIFLSFLLFLLQLGFALYFAPHPDDLNHFYPITPPSGWTFSSRPLDRLNNWDSFHYFEILERGYHSTSSTPTWEDIETFRTNGAFFPGYPRMARLFQVVASTFSFPVTSQTALILTSHFFAFVFWLYFFSIMNLWKVVPKICYFLALFILCYPGSFFTIAGYSESLFCASMLGFLYWCENWQRSGKKRYALLAITHGIVLSMTRLFAVPILIYPVVKSFSNLLYSNQIDFKSRSVLASSFKILFQNLFITIASFLGLIVFFIECHYQFGAWNFYLKVQKIGWGNTPSFFALFDPRVYFPKLFFENTIISINKCSAIFNLIFIVIVFFYDSFKGKLDRLGVYIASFGMFSMAIISKSNSSLDSLSRYTLPVFILVICALAQRKSEMIHLQKVSLKYKFRLSHLLAIFLLVLFLATQGWIAYRFMRGRWVT